MKTYAEALEPDARYQIVMTDDPVDGLRPLSFRDHYDMVADLALPAGAPDVVVRIYARALNALIYGWLDYELMVVAAGQALASLEFALKTRLGADAKKMPGLARRLAPSARAKLAKLWRRSWMRTPSSLALGSTLSRQILDSEVAYPLSPLVAGKTKWLRPRVL